MKIISIKKALSITTKVEKDNTKSVQAIIDQVLKKGDSALIEFEKKFNGVNVTDIQVTKKEISEAYRLVSKDQIAAIIEAKNRLIETESTRPVISGTILR